MSSSELAHIRTPILHPQEDLLLEEYESARAARHHERTRQLIPKVQVLIECWEHLVALPAELRACAARSVVVAGVDNA